MPALKNARHERFAQELAKGKSQAEAYTAAGFKGSDAAIRANASRLIAKDSVAARLAELTERAADKVVVDKAWVLERLRQNAETCMALDFVRGPNGEPTTSVTHNPAAANKALELLGKELGMFKGQVEQTSSGSLTVTYVNAATGPLPPPSEEDYETTE